MNFEMEGYECIYKYRQSKGGGGVAIYVDLNLTFKIVEAMTQVIDSLLECLTIQICIEKKKDIIISCVYIELQVLVLIISRNG